MFSNDWILSIDADERLDLKCNRRDKKLDLENSSYDGYSFARKNICWKKLYKSFGIQIEL